MTNTPDILKTILAKKAEEVAKRKSGMSIANLEEIAAGVERPRGFYNAIQNKVSAKKPAIIAEIKKASPSQGVIREDFQPILIGQDYAMNGATCLSVLTDKEFFQGSEAYLQMVRERCPLPVLRKDFMIDPYQIYEARALGADCILLIVAALEDDLMHELSDTATKLGMDVLVETHDAEELQTSAQTGYQTDRYQQPQFAHLRNIPANDVGLKEAHSGRSHHHHRKRHSYARRCATHAG